jgi:DNA-binding transcriptional LysR family regulator
MNIRFLETFVWLARFRNFRLTAEKLNTTQAAVSSRIISLEESFGVRLFDRTTREVTLTQNGQKALSYAERIVKLGGDMKRDISNGNVIASVIRIGVIECIVHSWFPTLVAHVHQQFPNVAIEINCETTQNLIERLKAGKVDLVLQTDAIVEDGIENLPLCEFIMRWVASPRLNLGRQTLELSELAGFPLISFSRNSGPHKILERIFPASADMPLSINCMTSVATMIRLACDGFGVTVVPPAIIQRELNENALEILRVSSHFPNLSTLASFRTSAYNDIAGHVARLAQTTASEFALHASSNIALPQGTASDPVAWRAD